MPLRYKKLFAPAILVIALASAVIAFVSVRSKTEALIKPNDPPPPAVESAKSSEKAISASREAPKPSSNISRERLEAELITILPTGFEPSEITRPQGTFILAVDNRSGLEEIELNLDRESGNREKHVRVPRNKIDWREAVRLNPGSYLLRETGHPGWVCRITVTAH